MYITIPLIILGAIIVYSAGRNSRNDEIQELNEKIEELEDESESWQAEYEELSEQ